MSNYLRDSVRHSITTKLFEQSGPAKDISQTKKWIRQPRGRQGHRHGWRGNKRVKFAPSGIFFEIETEISMDGKTDT